MKRLVSILALVGVLSLVGGCAHKPTFISGPLEQYQPVTLTFNGANLMENGPVNPFTDYRMTVRFTKEKRTIEVPGYFATDGNAAETSATTGHVWRCHFVPDEPGKWEYKAEYKYALNAAIDDTIKGTGVLFNGAKGTLEIKPATGNAPGFYRTGPLRYVGGRYLQFANSMVYLKNGSASPQNFLAYSQFDGMAPVGEQFVHRYESHVKDWVDEQVTWQDGKGKGIIGALNYLASQGVNCLGFSTYNIDLAGKDVSVWAAPGDMMHFDVSRLAQWELVFTHMDQLGIAMHVVLNDAQNNHNISRGRMGVERKLYYREMVARFAHHPAIIWDLGDEDISSQTRGLYAVYINRLDPYKHPIVASAIAPAALQVYQPLLGLEEFDGASVTASAAETHKDTLMWVWRSAVSGRPWFVCWDAIANNDQGVAVDAQELMHDENRMGLWGNLMAGGSGSECYFGLKTPTNNDRTCEDFRTRANVWKQGRIALDIMKTVPFPNMHPADDQVTSGHCLAGRGVYMVYLDRGQTAQIKVFAGQYDITWYNPRTGEATHQTSVVSVATTQKASPTPGPSNAKSPAKPANETDVVVPDVYMPMQQMNLGNPPKDAGRDWIVIVRAR